MLLCPKNYNNNVRVLMSKNFRSICLVFAVLLLILQFFTNANGQDLDVTIKIAVDKKITAEISGRFAPEIDRKNSRNLSLLNDYAGTTGLAGRFSNVRLLDRTGKPIGHKRFTASEFVSESDFGGFSYTGDLSPPSRPSAAAHVSWFKNDGGIVMLDDLLPQASGKSGRITFDVPTGWSITSSERRDGPQTFSVADVEKAVFYIGSDRREKILQVGKSRLTLSLSGEWLFSDDEAAATATSIFLEYERLFAISPEQDLNLAVLKFPVAINPGNWEADTRGRSVTIISSDMPFKSQSKQRLHEQLRHEIFHLWIPNGVNLSGNYDWFYEGFALYQSLKTGLATNTIGFDNFLDTLSRAYSIDRSQSSQLSLIEASKNRFSGANTQVYARGMIVAFLCDLALLNNSKGKRSVQNILREIFQKYHNATQRNDGNEAVLAAFAKHAELRPIVDRYINGNEKIDWREYVSAAGLESGEQNSTARLTVLPKLTSRQKDLLDKLGYNTWRKLSDNSK